MKKLLIIIVTLWALPSISAPRALTHVIPMSDTAASARQPYCTYSRIENFCCPDECVEGCQSSRAMNSLCSCCESTVYCTGKSVLWMVSLITCPFFCLKDTVCLPCDRNENPPESYPYTKLACYHLSFGKLGNNHG